MRNMADRAGKEGREFQDVFTLVELLMVIVIIGVITSVSVPTFRGFMQNQRLSNAARELTSNLRYARMQAVNERNQWVVLFQPVPRRYIIFADDGGGFGIATHPEYIEDNRGNLQPDPGERVFGQFELTEGVEFGMVVSSGLPNGLTAASPITFAGSPPRVVFYPNGSARETGVIMLQLSTRLRSGNPTGQRAVILYRPTGFARVFEYHATGDPPWR